ncbi:MAG: helix-turn-helix transcriptional regulator [Roseiflexaceae bacterium]|nr:helix-turn-helix transcriptional regulator [Roseiflexaceae bacterium]
MKIIYRPERDSLELPGILYALGDPVRLTIVTRLASKGELTCGIAYPDLIPKSTLSHHLKILREAGVIHVRQQGREYHNSLRRDDLEARFPGLLRTIVDVAVPR